VRKRRGVFLWCDFVARVRSESNSDVHKEHKKGTQKHKKIRVSKRQTRKSHAAIGQRHLRRNLRWLRCFTMSDLAARYRAPLSRTLCNCSGGHAVSEHDCEAIEGGTSPAASNALAIDRAARWLFNSELYFFFFALFFVASLLHALCLPSYSETRVALPPCCC
jgi:hypothetical protein